MLRNRVWNILQWFCYIPAHTRIWTFTLANHRVHEHTQLHENGCFPMCGNRESITRILRERHILLLFTIEAPQEPLQLLSSAYNHHIDKTGTNPKLDTAFLSHHTKRGRHKDNQWRYIGYQRKQNPSHCSSLHTLCLDRIRSHFQTMFLDKELTVLHGN